MDVFCEYMVKRKKTGMDLLYEFMCLFVALCLSAFIFVLFFGRIMGFEVFLIAGVWFLAIRFLGKANIEYEYTLTNNILDIDRIMAKKTRKRVISIDFAEIEECRYAEAKDKDRNVSFKTMDMSGDLAEDGVYLIDFSKDGEKCRAFFRPNGKILNNLKMMNPRKVSVRDEDLV